MAVGLTTSLNIGLSGLQVTQAALNVVGHNIANVNTPGYSRQRAVITSNGAILSGGLQFGNGAGVTQIMGVRDRFLELQINQSTSKQQGATVRSSGLEALASAFQDQGDDGLSVQVQKFFQSFQELSARPQEMSIRANVIGRAQNMITGMQARYSMLDQQRDSLNRNIPTYVEQLNSLSTEIAALNAKIAAEPLPGGESDARDQRQALALQISEVAGVQVYLDDHDQLNITFGNGVSLVNGSQASAVRATTPVQPPLPDPEGFEGNLFVIEVANGTNSWARVTRAITEGRLGGTLDLRDNVIPGFQRQMDELAAGIVGQVNLIHATGTGLPPANATGDFFFQGVDPIDGTTGLPTSISAANHYKNMVANMSINSVISGDPSRIAASSAANAPANNVNALALASLETKTNTVDTVGTGVGNSGPYSTVLGGLVNAIGTTAQIYRSQTTTNENLLTALQNQRDQVSGVDLDEEAGKLMTLQRGYSASARFLSVINQLTDQLVNNTLR